MYNLKSKHNSQYHKIRNIELNVCAAEQKIAYNFAFVCAHRYIDILSCDGIKKAELINAACNEMLNAYINSYSDLTTKFSLDYAICAFRAGFEKYIADGMRIYSNYEDIGAVFPAYYLNSEKG